MTFVELFDFSKYSCRQALHDTFYSFLSDYKYLNAKEVYFCSRFSWNFIKSLNKLMVSGRFGQSQRSCLFLSKGSMGMLFLSVVHGQAKRYY